MTWTVTGRGSGDFTYSSGGTVGNIFTPAEDTIVIMATILSGTSTFTGSGFGATWVDIGTFDGTAKINILAARIGAGASAGRPTISTGSATFSTIVIEITGAAISPSVADLFIQNQEVGQYNPTSPLAIPTLAAFASSTNLSLSFGGLLSTGALTPQSGWTEAQEVVSPTNNNISANYLVTEDTTHTVEGPGFSYNNVAGVGFEIDEETGGGSPVVVIFRRRIEGY